MLPIIHVTIAVYFIPVYSSASDVDSNKPRPTEEQWQELIRLTPDMCLFYFYFICLIMLACDMDGVASPQGWYLLPIMLAEILALASVILPVAIPFFRIYQWNRKRRQLTKKCTEQSCSEWDKRTLAFWLDEQLGMKVCAESVIQTKDISAKILLEANDRDLDLLGVYTPVKRKRLRFALRLKISDNPPDSLSLADNNNYWYKKWTRTPEHLQSTSRSVVVSKSS